MPTDRRLFDSSSMTPPPAPEIDAVTNNVETTDAIKPVSVDEWISAHSTLKPFMLDEAGDVHSGWQPRSPGALLRDRVIAHLRNMDINAIPHDPSPTLDPMVIITRSDEGGGGLRDRHGDRWFRVGDIVTRDGTDRQRVIETDGTDDCAPTTITVECIKEPLGWLNDDGTRETPWCSLGEREFNLARRYAYADDAIDGGIRRHRREGEVMPARRDRARQLYYPRENSITRII